MNARLTVKVTPGASRSEIVGWADGMLRVRVAAAPERDKANRELLVFLARALGTRKSAVAITGGRTGRTKTVSVQGMTLEEIMAKLGVNEEGA
jgi:uncharacterized protein (TIGR00251 family)